MKSTRSLRAKPIVWLAALGAVLVVALAASRWEEIYCHLLPARAIVGRWESEADGNQRMVYVYRFLEDDRLLVDVSLVVIDGSLFPGSEGTTLELNYEVESRQLRVDNPLTEEDWLPNYHFRRARHADPAGRDDAHGLPAGPIRSQPDKLRQRRLFGLPPEIRVG